MDNALIEQKIDALRHAVERVRLRMRRAVGFRNIAVHSYETIDWDIVHSLCTQRLSDFSEFAQAVVRWLEQSASP